MMEQADLDVSVEMQKTADEHIRKALEMRESGVFSAHSEILMAIERRMSSIAYLFHRLVEQYLQEGDLDDDLEDDDGVEYRCPECGYTYVKREGDPVVELCPNDGVPLDEQPHDGGAS